eukprot:c20022_g1_i2.p1 GENE.c20022_g1_i2~~c20022_g1_i2.p1  ORF type:complete len:100 (-),score=6.17 c20022_g1_i2:270-569(-)
MRTNNHSLLAICGVGQRGPEPIKLDVPNGSPRRNEALCNAAEANVPIRPGREHLGVVFAKDCVRALDLGIALRVADVADVVGIEDYNAPERVRGEVPVG